MFGVSPALVILLLAGSASSFPVFKAGLVDPGWPPFTAGVEYEFRNTSLNVDGADSSIEWDFDYNFLFATVDSTERNGRWAWRDAGDYAIRLKVCNNVGCDTVIKLVEVVLPSIPPPLTPPGVIFADGFESGSLSAWSKAVP